VNKGVSSGFFSSCICFSLCTRTTTKVEKKVTKNMSDARLRQLVMKLVKTGDMRQIKEMLTKASKITLLPETAEMFKAIEEIVTRPAPIDWAPMVKMIVGLIGGTAVAPLVLPQEKNKAEMAIASQEKTKKRKHEEDSTVLDSFKKKAGQVLGKINESIHAPTRLIDAFNSTKDNPVSIGATTPGEIKDDDDAYDEEHPFGGISSVMNSIGNFMMPDVKPVKKAPVTSRNVADAMLGGLPSLILGDEDMPTTESKEPTEPAKTATYPEEVGEGSFEAVPTMPTDHLGELPPSNRPVLDVPPNEEYQIDDMKLKSTVAPDINTWEAARSAVYSSFGAPFAMLTAGTLGGAMGFSASASAFAAYNAFSAINLAETTTVSERYGMKMSQPIINMFAKEVYGRAPPLQYPKESLSSLGHDETGPQASSAVVKVLGGQQKTHDQKKLAKNSYENWLNNAVSPFAI
jgi:hypothetical protein